MGTKGWAGAFVFECPFGNCSIGCHFDFAAAMVVAGDIEVFEADLDLICTCGDTFERKGRVTDCIGATRGAGGNIAPAFEAELHVCLSCCCSGECEGGEKGDALHTGLLLNMRARLAEN